MAFWLPLLEMSLDALEDYAGYVVWQRELVRNQWIANDDERNNVDIGIVTTLPCNGKPMLEDKTSIGGGHQLLDFIF